MDKFDCIRAFQAVADFGSFTNAAKKLGLSTNLMSKRVSHLEDRLGVRLLNRTTRQVSLTEAGQSYLNESRPLVEEFERIENSISDSHYGTKGHLRIAVPTTFSERYLAPITANFLRQWPDITVELSLTDNYVDLVADGFDMAIRIGTLDDSSAIAKRLSSTTLVVCASPTYLAQRKPPRKPEDLEHHECIVDTNFRNYSVWPLKNQSGGNQTKVSGRLKLNSAEASRNAALTGYGIALCPAYSVAQDILEGKLVPLLQDYISETMGIYALYPGARYLPRKVRIYIDFLGTQLDSTFSGGAISIK